ncbi:hypothetical protein ALP91_00173 [Pseudomonas savastanoi pv. glycinea]|nr:hypothetical protein ALP91_00173 [Pseudomonas savastanoi pv. glycinea]
MLQSTSSLLQAATGISCRACAMAVRVASVNAPVQLNSYYGYWFSHWRA